MYTSTSANFVDQTQAGLLSEAKAAAEQTWSAKEREGHQAVLLGTGAGLLPGRSRHMTSHVILSNGVAGAVDCGLGVTDPLAYPGIPLGAVRAIFMIHHHPDHNIEYGPLRDWLGTGAAAFSAGLRPTAETSDGKHYAHVQVRAHYLAGQNSASSPHESSKYLSSPAASI